MTLEQRLVNELRAERDVVPVAKPRHTTEGPSPWPRRVAMAAAVAVIVGGGAVVVTAIGRGGVVAAGANEVALGPLAVPVTGEEVTVGGVTMDVAAPAPPLLAGVDMPGTEVTLDTSGPPGEAHLPNDTDGPMVYIGTVAGQAVVLHDDNPPIAGIGEELASLLSRLTNGPMYCANTDGCSHATGEPSLGLGHSRSGQGPFVVSATGFDLPPDTAAILVTTADGAAYWQRPAGNAVTILWEQQDAPRLPYTFVGLDPSGSEILRETFR